MKRKTYIKPTIMVVFLKQHSPLLNSSLEGDLGAPQEPEGGEQSWE